MSWISQNKEWLFGGIIPSCISFFLGKKYAEYKISKKMEVNGNGNRTGDNYYEDNSIHLTKIMKGENVIDYEKVEELTLGASGVDYTSPENGAFYVKGLTGKFCLNGKIEEAVLPEGKQINVKKGDRVTLFYNNQTQNTELKFYYAKESAD